MLADFIIDALNMNTGSGTFRRGVQLEYLDALNTHDQPLAVALHQEHKLPFYSCVLPIIHVVFIAFVLLQIIEKLPVVHANLF